LGVFGDCSDIPIAVNAELLIASIEFYARCNNRFMAIIGVGILSAIAKRTSGAGVIVGKNWICHRRKVPLQGIPY
jgi:hypothetical protein